MLKICVVNGVFRIIMKMWNRWWVIIKFILVLIIIDRIISLVCFSGVSVKSVFC